MDASISAQGLDLLDRSISELNQSFLEDMQIGGDATVAIGEQLNSMKSLLKYVTAPSNVYYDCGKPSLKVVFVAQVKGCQAHLYLDEAGSFVSAVLCDCHRPQMTCAHYRTLSGTSFWRDVPISLLFSKLQEITARAEKREEEHAAALRRARQKLDKIMAVIRS